jgi:signal transduction histidine kinase/ligand-binding sensor domain-containing protein
MPIPGSHPLEIPTCLTAVRSLAYFSALLVLNLYPTGVRAQYRFDHWTADNGLPQNSVYGIVQTRDGYLWLATVDGLARFDGVRFTIFNKSNSPGIINNRFISLFEDARGDLWAGTEESGIVRYHNGRFSHYAAGDDARTFWIGDGDADGDPMVLINDWKVLHFKHGQFALFDSQIESFEAVRDVPRKNARLFCAANQVLNSSGCYSNGRWLRFSQAEDSFVCSVCPAVQDAGGNFWLVTDRRELVRVENGKTVRRFNEATGLPKIPLNFVTGAKLSLVSWDGKDSLWLTDLATLSSELLLKVPAAAPLMTGDIYPPYEMADYNIFLSSYQDSEGNLWFGTQRGGLYRARKQIVTTFSRNEGLTETNVYPIYEDADGTLLVGTTRGLFRFQNGSFAPVESAENFYVQAIGRDPAGRIVVSNNGDLYVREKNRFVPFLRGQIPVSDNSDFIYAIHSDGENRLWIGSTQGLTRFSNGAATTFTATDGLAGNDVKVIIDARGGGLWIGTYGGLSLFKDGKLTSWTENEGLPSRTIRTLYEDADAALWIGSYDGGLSRFKDGKFTRYNTKTGLPNDGAFQILEDDNRHFWISSNRGIYRVGKDELNEFADGRRANVTAVAYGKSDGMLNAECNGGRSPAGIRARDGRLWFPTQDGVAVIDPQNIKTNSQPPPVVIETIKIDNRSVANETLESAVRDSRFAIQIRPGQDNFEIEYTALSFIYSANLRFKYKLEGLDQDWVEAGTRRTAYYSYVPPGDYTFTVIAANRDGVWNTEGKNVRITVLPPFYRTWWFLTLIALATGGAVFAAFKSRVAQLERKQAAQQVFARQLLESQEGERKRIAAELHDSLAQNLLVIKNRAQLQALTLADEQARAQFTEISDAVSQTLEEVRTISYDLRPPHLDQLGLRTALVAMIEKVCASSTIQFTHAVDELDGIFRPGDEITLYRIVQECLNNILRHSGATKVALNIVVDAGELALTIRDNGRGFTLDEETRRRAGLGLQGIAERVRILGGTHAIKSAPGQGTTVMLRIALKDRQR